MPYVSVVTTADDQAIEESPEDDSPVLQVETGEPSIVGSLALPPPAAEKKFVTRTSLGVPYVAQKGKRPLEEGHGGEAEKRARPDPSSKKKIRAVASITIDDEFNRKIKAQNIKETISYILESIKGAYEMVARLDVATKSVFKKIEDSAQWSEDRKNELEKQLEGATKEIEVQKKEVAKLREVIAKYQKDGQATSFLVKKEAADEAARHKKDIEEQIAMVKKQWAAEVDLLKISSAEMASREKRITRLNLADATAKLTEEYEKKLAVAKADAIKEYADSAIFEELINNQHRDGVDTTLMILKEMGEIDKDFDHTRVYYELTRENRGGSC